TEGIAELTMTIGRAMRADNQRLIRQRELPDFGTVTRPELPVLRDQLDLEVVDRIEALVFVVGRVAELEIARGKSVAGRPLLAQGHSRRRGRLAELFQEVEVEITSPVRLAPLLEVHGPSERPMPDELRLLDLAHRHSRVRPEMERVARLPPI